MGPGFATGSKGARVSPTQARAVRFALNVEQKAAGTADAEEPPQTLAVGMSTPPRAEAPRGWGWHRAVPGSPERSEEPAAGCTLEELRTWTIAQFKHVKRDANDLETRAAGKMNADRVTVEACIGRTETLGHGFRELNGCFDAAVNDVGVFGTIRNFVTESSLQAKMERVDHELKVLSAQGNDFVANLDAHLVKIETVEQSFKQHVQSSFATVEKELNMIKRAVEGVNAGKGDVNSNVAQRVIMLEVNMQKEVAVINDNIQTLKAGVESVPLLISSAMNANCHCVHVDQLDGRLAVLEVAAAAGTGVGQAGGPPDVWRG